MEKEINNNYMDFVKWLEANRNELPLNSVFWEIEIQPFEMNNTLYNKEYKIKLGKYKARIRHSNPFFKPYTKIFKF